MAEGDIVANALLSQYLAVVPTLWRDRGYYTSPGKRQWLCGIRTDCCWGFWLYVESLVTILEIFMG